MSRWHKEDCWAPVVVLRDLQPICKSCSGVFSLETTLASQQCGQRSFEKLPPDRAQGQLNLWWPPSVKYVNGQESHQHNNDMTERSQTQPREDDMTTPQPEAASTSIMNGTYGKTLPQGSFRLICMQGTTEPGEPIHVELETYRHSHCPSYETVSYAWGGESGDSSPCRPVFVGPYWDVLLQTENCWQMLRYARPTRGIRLLWVDAICINQDNDEERAAQVAMMARIYNCCERTLVYLGPEVVKWHGDQLPERKGLHELAGAGQSGDHAKAEDHRRLLESRKYFTRLWIIQELILSPKVIIPIDNVIYWADHTTDSRIRGASGGAWDWWDNTVPWAKSMGKEEFPVQNASEALLLTTQNQSSDPRDRLFGVLALLRSDHTKSPPFRANYNLSNQHVWIGFFGHSIANDGALWVLHNASGHKAGASVPSWAPDWNSHDMWSGFSRHVVNETDKSEFGQWIDTRDMDVRHISTKDLALASHDWQQDIAVDAASGALIGVRAMRLFTFVEKPKFFGISPSGGYLVFRVEDNPYFSLVSSERLDDVVQPLMDHLYLLRIGSEIIFLVLREHEPTSLKVGSWNSHLLRYAPTPDAKRCRLIASCTSLPVSSPSIWSTRVPDVLRVPNLQYHISRLREALSEGLHGTVLFAPLVREQWGFLPLYWAIEEEGRVPTLQCSDAILPDAYLACLPAIYQTRTDQSYITLTITDGSDATIQEMNDWLTSEFAMWFGYKSLGRPVMIGDYIDWEWSVDNTRWTKFADLDFTVKYREWSHAEAAYREDNQIDGRAAGTWNFNPIPCSQISGAAAGAFLDHGITIPKGDGAVRLRAPTQSILRCINSFRCIPGFYLINKNLHDLAKYLNLTSVEEVQDILLDTSRDWSHFKFQIRGLRDEKGPETIQFSSEMQLIDIF